MKLLFIGSVYPKELLNFYINNTTYLDLPADALQWSIISGLQNIYNINIFSIPLLKSKYSNFLSTYQFNYNNTYHNYIIGYFNVLGIKEFQASNKAIQLINQYNFDYDVIFISIMGTCSLRIAYYLKKKFPNIKVILLVTDLPQYMRSRQSILYRIGKKIEALFSNKYIKLVNGFVFLSKYMNDKINISNKPYVVVEGIYNDEDEDKINSFPICFDNKYKNILYTGNLSQRYGIKTLVEAFMLIDNPKYKLHICGNGDSINYIKDCIKIDNRIKYWGVLSRKEILKMQQNASLLVNPRTSEGEYTKYSFPSKTMEYLASGTPTLLYKLLGIPDEYYNYCFTINDNGVKILAHRMVEILELDKNYLKTIGENARQFILEQKNPISQCNKIVDLINKI